MGSIRSLKRKNRRKTVFIVFLTIVIIILGLAMAGILIKQYKESTKPVYEYVSMTEEASARAYVWLCKIEDTDLSYDDVKSCMGDFNLEVIKTPLKEKGKYERKLADGAYEYLVSQSEAGLESAYYFAIMRRIRNSGYEGDINEELVNRLMDETFGMSVTEYLDQCNISLLPSEQELREKYEGEVSSEDN